MRGGIVAIGVILVFIGFAPWVLPLVGVVAAPALGFDSFSNLSGVVLFLCCLSPALLAAGSMVFLAGLVAKSPEEIEALKRPQVVYVQQAPVWPPPPVPPAQPPQPPRPPSPPTG